MGPHSGIGGFISRGREAQLAGALCISLWCCVVMQREGPEQYLAEASAVLPSFHHRGPSTLPNELFRHKYFVLAIENGLRIILLLVLILSYFSAG